ncbi:hypothetical protein GCM10009554_50790 [Kribbella koreensis]|uniref:Uncharacterized protein n=1 Tax=Kribbella koreensis TaxID=57909 RepID=A0ABP4BGJ8_9ACTN
MLGGGRCFAVGVSPVKWFDTRWRDWRAYRLRNAYYGACPACRHDWREHLPDEGCSECQYEIDHEAPGAPLTVCPERAPGVTF